MNISLGLDVGNAAMKLVGPYHQDRLLIPHVLVPADGIHRDPALVPAGEDPIDHLHAELTTSDLQAPVTVFAGSLGAREYPERVQEVQTGEQKAKSDRHLVLALVALAAAVRRYNIQNPSLRLAVSLPMAEAMDSSARWALESRLLGLHTVRWVSTPAWAPGTTQLRIQAVEVVPEGAAAYLQMVSRSPEIRDGYTLVLDVGARSVDWAVFTPGGRFSIGLSGGAHDGGIVAAADRILAATRRQHGPDMARHREDVLGALATSARTGGPVQLWRRGRAIDVSDLAREELTRLARDVNRLVGEALAKAGRVDRILLVGGGGALLAAHLQAETDLPMQIVPEPEWANAQGLYLRARRANREEGRQARQEGMGK